MANRTYGSAVKLAGELKGYAIHFDKLHEAMADADVVISATGAPHQILTYDQVKESVLPENRGSLVMVDLANPRDIDEKVKDLGVKLFNIDDLNHLNTWKWNHSYPISGSVPRKSGWLKPGKLLRCWAT